MKKKTNRRYRSLAPGGGKNMYQLPLDRADALVNWRKIAITLIDHDFGEQTAQAGENV